MVTTAIIAEYNPLHNGHEYQLKRCRREGATHLVCIMSGNFVQRGQAAVFDKWCRAKAALLAGADLVLELPLPFACANAERFAQGAAAMLAALGCVDFLCFGSESADITRLEKIAAALDHPELSLKIRPLLKKGMTFAAARQQALSELIGEDAALLKNPNDILGVEYIRALHAFAPDVRPVCMGRKGAAHDAEQADGLFASASFIRRLLCEKKNDLAFSFVPDAALPLYLEAVTSGRVVLDARKSERALLYQLRGMSAEDFFHLPDLSEGLHNRLYRAARTATGLAELLRLCKTKRYPLARIRRAVLHAYLGVTARDQQLSARYPLPYLRILGMNRRGAEILAKARQHSDIPIDSSLARLSKTSERALHFCEIESKSTDIFYLATEEIQPCGLDFTTPPVIQ